MSKSKAMLRIRAGSRTIRVNSYDSNMIRKPPKGFWHCADQRGTDSYDSNTTRKPPQRPWSVGIAPIKRVPTAMFSLVNTPMFEQEAPKWYTDEPRSSGTYVWAVLCIQLSLVPEVWASSLLNEYDDKDSASRKWNDRGPELSGMSALLYCL